MKTVIITIIFLNVCLLLTGQNFQMKMGENHVSNLYNVTGLSSPESLNDSFQKQPNSRSATTVSKVFMGTSINAFTLLVQEQNCMHYDKSLNAIMFTYRGNNVSVTGLPAPIGTGNDFVTAWSTNMGSSFTNKLSLVGTTTLRNRYPSGVIYNPTGNTNLNLAYSLVAGPVTNGSQWTNTVLSSIQYNGNSLDKDYLPTSTYGELVRQGLNVCSNGKAYICTIKQMNDGTNYTDLKGHVKTGTFNNSTLGFDWTEQDITLPFYLVGGYPEANGNYANMAWSKSGSVGYFMVIGVDSRSGVHKGFYPIIYKSTDQGNTWQLQDYFDFSIFPDVFAHIWSTLANPAVAVPEFQEADMVVDGSGNLHIMALCKGSYSQHPDSLGYTYSYENGSIFEFSKENNQWQCHYIDHPKTREVSGADSPFVTNPAPNIGWDMRLQASRTDDGSKVFAVWTDTDWQFWGMADSLNLYPDVMLWGRNVNTNQSTSVKNITYLQNGMGESHFMFVSPVAMDNAGVYDIPVSISDINTSSLNGDLPIAHYYLTGVELTESDFTGNPGTFLIATSSNPSSGGTTSGGGSYTSGQLVTVQALSNSGWSFTNWTENGNIVSTSASYQFTVAGNRTLVANFIQQQLFTISTTSAPAIGGVTAGGGNYLSGSQCTVSATANAGYIFVNWTEFGSQVSSTANYTFTVAGNRDLVANFTAQQFTVIASANPIAGGFTTGGGNYLNGALVTLTATPSTGWYFSNWTEGGSIVSTSSTYQFQIDANHTLVANFTQSQQSTILVIKPNGGENWLVGSVQNITWNSTGITNVKLEYTTNNGGTWTTIISIYPANSSSYSWTVPSTPSTQCKVRISDNSNPALFDLSDNLFAISTSSQSILVVSPNGGEMWQAGSVQNISWASTGIANLKIEYTTTNGASWTTITTSYPANTSNYPWAVPNLPSTQCRVRISDSGNASLSDISNNPFIISTGGQSTPEICIVSVDGTNNKNMIVWEKPYSTTIDHYNIYQESNQANVYTLIGIVPYNQLSVFTDLSSNTQQQSNRYKISLLDIYNNETTLSNYHTTIHLNINQGVGNSFNLMWNNYEGFTYPSYNIYRGTSVLNMSLFATVASTINSFTDLYPPVGYVYYKIEVLKSVPCSPSKAEIGSSVSNISSNDPYLSTETYNSTGWDIRVFPNPTVGRVELQSKEPIQKIIIYNSLGIKIRQLEPGQMDVSVDLSENEKGIYIFHLTSNNKVFTKKVILM